MGSLLAFACLVYLLSPAMATMAERPATAPVDKAGADAGGYLFATFKGEQTPMTEQVYFGLSRDGLTWEALNGGEPVLVSKVGEKGVRDPFLIRSPDRQKYFLIATDLSIHLSNHDWGRAVRRGSKSIVVWESDDLVNWSEPRLEEVAPADAGCTWAPQAIYDRSTQDYLVYWASTTARDDFAKHRMWAARTKDFRTFSEPFIYIERPQAMIDTDIVYDETSGRYFRFSKDETTKATIMESSDDISGEWTEMEDFSLAELTGYEGPACFRLRPAEDGSQGRWCLLLDHYARGQGYKAWTTDSLPSGQFTPNEEIHFPFRFRHGSVLPLSPAEYERVKSAYGG